MRAFRLFTETWLDFVDKTTEAVSWLALFAAAENLMPATTCLWKYWYAGQPADVVPLLTVQDPTEWESYAVASVVGALTTVFGSVAQPNAPHAT